jgi:hypothetical protein
MLEPYGLGLGAEYQQRLLSLRPLAEMRVRLNAVSLKKDAANTRNPLPTP